MPICQFIVSPGFWKNHDAALMAILPATQDYSNLTFAQAHAIVSDNSDQYHRFLLSAELNTVWSGDPQNPGLGGRLGSAIYSNPAFPNSPLNGMTVDAINHLAFISNPNNAGADLLAYLTYVGSTGENNCGSSCLVTQPRVIPTPTVTPTATSTATPAPTPTNTPKHAIAHSQLDTLRPVPTPTPSWIPRLELIRQMTPTPTPQGGAEFCTLTQSAWGMPAGIANGSVGFLTLNPGLLPVTIGGPGRSTTLHTPDAVMAYLPTRGLPKALSPGDREFYAAGDIERDGGGKLSGETAAMTLALYLSDSGATLDGLGSFVLSSRPLCTQGLTAGLDGILGTEDDELDLRSPINGPWTLPGNVVGSGMTVRDLVILANQSLGGINGVASPVDVYNAVVRVNRAFDRCRRIVECP